MEIKTGLTLRRSNEQIAQANDRFVLAYQNDMPPAHQGVWHCHEWYQLMYASSGLLTVSFADQMVVIPPHKAIWLPPNCEHRTFTAVGAKFRSLYFRPDQVKALGQKSKVLSISPLIKALILEVVARCDVDLIWDAMDFRLLTVLLDQLSVQKDNGLTLSIPKDARLIPLVETIQMQPSNEMNLDAWAKCIGVSSRTISRAFNAQTGMGFKEWRQRLRLLYSLELLEKGLSVTQVALEVGYSSPSAFTYAFHRFFHCTPKSYFS
ncbi:helix-turn-helix transcriptional regulator [Marinomonas sp. 15G1-11]|uniref:Helix-turn-helix transcriptional regulator n=1 Tax=Marinomonas phaeophyticola TaxID=3004091 RepID=A0ABT4JZ83_9GAMM|nr:helix-turn-helix transcriptional regulator [Marinomonas sp. 15G1-11]MCZ2723695.1 helix-turn-helix transcriptional regulator [Marinomonas sp. 15G1-11]